MSQSSPTSFCGSSLSIQPLVCVPLLDSGTLPSKPILPVGAAECDGSQRPNCAPSVSPRYRSPRRRRASRRSIPTCNKTNSPRPTPLNRARDKNRLLHFLMRRMLPARIAELLRLQPVAVLLLVLGGRVVSVFTVVALQCDDFAHCRLLDNLGHGACTHRVAAFPDRKPQPLLQRYRRDQCDLCAHIISRHHHLHSRRQLHVSRHVRRPEIKLRPVSRKEWRVPPALFLRQHVRFRLELRVRRDRSRPRQHLPALHFILFRAAQQQSHVVSRDPFIQQLPEHLHARYRLLHRRTETNDLNLFSHLHLAALDSSRHHRPAARDRKNVLDRHRERLIHIPLRQRYVLIHRFHQIQYRLLPLRVAFQRLQRRSPDHRQRVPRKLIALEQLAHFQFHQFQQLRIVHHVALVQKHADVRHAHLPRQQYVLPRLRHRSVRRRHHQYRSVHLRRARDHVLHVIGVTWAVDVRVVTVRRLILHVRHRNRDPALPLLGRVIDRIERPERHLRVVLRQHLRDRRRQRRLAMVNVPDRPDIDVRLAPLEFLLRHLPHPRMKNVAATPLWPQTKTASTAITLMLLRFDGAGDGARTRDHLLGRQRLYH